MTEVKIHKVAVEITSIEVSLIFVSVTATTYLAYSTVLKVYTD